MSFKFHYKWPTLTTSTTSTNIQQNILTNKKTGEEVSISKNTINTGTATVIFYFICLLYIYTSGAVNNNGIYFNIDSISSSVKSMKGLGTETFKSIKDLSIFNLNTLSSSFKGSERIGTTICLVIFLALLQGLFSYQNIYSNDPKRAPVIAFNYVIVLCWLLFLYIFPSTVVGNQEKTSIPHLILAIFVLVSIIINAFLIANLYTDYFDEKSVEPLTGIAYALVAFSVLSAITMIFSYAADVFYKTKTGIIRNWISKDKYTYYAHVGVAYSEMACLVLFGIFLIIFIQFPPLPSDKLSCIMIPETQTQSPGPV